MMDLEKVVKEIREILESKRDEFNLTFTEEDHKYMMVNTDGEVVDTHPSVSKVTKLFYEEFDAEGIAYNKAKGNIQYMWSSSSSAKPSYGSIFTPLIKHYYGSI